MFAHRKSLAVLTSGLMIAVGTTGGCHLVRGFRLNETPRSRWHHVDSPSLGEESFGDDFYTPETELSAPDPSRGNSSSSQLPPEPELPPLPTIEQRLSPAPPAVEPETVPQARWRPALPRRSSSVSSDNSQNTNTDALPPARVTYDSEPESFQEPEITPVPEDAQSGQPRLFRPAGSAKSLFDSMKRKWSR